MAKRPPALSVKLYVTMPPAGSVEAAVMPTAVPLAAFSFTALAAGSLSTGAEGARLFTLIVKLLVLVRLPSLASTVIVWLVADSKLSRLPLRSEERRVGQ